MKFIRPANLIYILYIYNRLCDNIPDCHRKQKIQNSQREGPIIQNDTSTTEYTFKMKFIYK